MKLKSWWWDDDEADKLVELSHSFLPLWSMILVLYDVYHFQWVSVGFPEYHVQVRNQCLGMGSRKRDKKYFFLTQKCGCFLFLPPSLKYNLNSTIFVKLWKGDLSPRIQQNPLTITSTSFYHYPENISSISGSASWTEKRSSIKERIHHQQSWRTKFETRTDSLGTLNEGMKDWQLSFTHTGDFVITGNSMHMFTTQLNCCI